jgi:hypothetical protein
MHWCRTALHSWAASGLLLLLGLWFWFCAPRPEALSNPAWEASRILILCVFIMAATFMAARALSLTVRVLSACSAARPRREWLAEQAARLDSHSMVDRVQAVEALAAAYGEPFGPVDIARCSPAQLRALCLLYKEWWRAESDADEPLPEHEHQALLCRVIARTQALRDSAELPPPGEAKHPEAGPALARLPLLPPERLVSALRPYVEETLCRVARVINMACHDIPFSHSEYRVRRLFTQLCWEAFECGWQLRFAAAEGRLPRIPAAPRPSVRKPQPPAPAASQPSVGWAEKYRRMSAPETTAPVREGTTGPAGGSGEMTWGELVAALRRKVDETLDRLNDAIKDALIDGELPVPSDDDAQGARPLAPLSREQFIEAMRPRMEEALRGMADSLNESGGADAIGELLEALLRDALQTGLEMRANPQTADSLVPQESLH